MKETRLNTLMLYTKCVSAMCVVLTGHLNGHVTKDHADREIIGNKDMTDESINLESLNRDSMGLYTIYFKTLEKYPVVFEEFRKYCIGSPVISSGRHEDSYLVSYRVAGELLEAINGSKNNLKMSNMKLVQVIE